MKNLLSYLILKVARKRAYATNKFKPYFNVVKWIVPRLINNRSPKNKSIKVNEVTNLANKIWFFWWQGLDEAPEIVKFNYANLVRQYPDNQVVLITDANYLDLTDISPKIIQRLKKGEMTVTHFSDVLRFNLLKNHGGLWIDATVYLSPAFSLPDSDAFFTVSHVEDSHAKFISLNRWSAWMISGPAHYPLFDFMDTAFCNYWEYNQRLVDYYLVDDLIGIFYEKNQSFKSDISKLDHDSKEYALMERLEWPYSTNDEELFREINTNKKYSIQKLSYKLNYVNPDSVYSKFITL